MHGASPSNQEGILGRYHRSSSARREPRPPLHQGRRLLAVLDGRYQRPAPVHADRCVPASSCAPRTRGWRLLPGARQSPIRAASVSPAFVHLSSAWKWLPDTANHFVRHSFRLLTHGWDSQWQELKVWSATARKPARKSKAPIALHFRLCASGKCRTGLP